MKTDDHGQLILNEKQKEQLAKLMMGLRNGEMIYLDDNEDFQKGKMETDDDNDPVSRDDTSYI